MFQTVLARRVLCLCLAFSQVVTPTTARAGRASHIIVHLGSSAIQVLGVVMIVAVLRIVREGIHMQHLTGDPLAGRTPAPNKTVRTIVAEAVHKLVDDPEKWMGGASSLAAMGAVGVPFTQTLNLIAGSSTARQAFADLVSDGVVALLTAGGWEAGQELWVEARKMLSNPADIARAQSMSPLLTALIFPDSADPETKRVAYEMLKNMWQIVGKDSNLRNRYIYNTWRKRYATGDFATQLVFILASLAMLQKASPGYMRVLVYGFAILVGALSPYVPEDVTEAVTDWVTHGRKRWNQSEFEFCKTNVTNAIQEYASRKTPEPLRTALGSCEASRNHLTDIQLEVLYTAYQRIGVLLRERELASVAEYDSTVRMIDRRIDASQLQILGAIRELHKFYDEEHQFYLELCTPTTAPQVVQALKEEVARNRKVATALDSLLNTLDPRQNGFLPNSQQQKFLAELYDNGFDEQTLFDSQLQFTLQGLPQKKSLQRHHATQ